MVKSFVDGVTFLIWKKKKENQIIILENKVRCVFFRSRVKRSTRCWYRTSFPLYHHTFNNSDSKTYCESSTSTSTSTSKKNEKEKSRRNFYLTNIKMKIHWLFHLRICPTNRSKTMYRIVACVSYIIQRWRWIFGWERLNESEDNLYIFLVVDNDAIWRWIWLQST